MLTKFTHLSNIFIAIMLLVSLIFDFIYFDWKFETKKIYSLYSTFPPIIYLIYVLILNLGFNVTWGNMRAPYNFLNFGAKTGWFGFDLSQMGSDSLGIGVVYMVIIICIIFVLLALLFLKIINVRKKYCIE